MYSIYSTGIDDIDFTRYPKKAYQLDWIQYYLECKAEINGLSTADVTAMDVEDFYIKSNKFALVSKFDQSMAHTKWKERGTSTYET